MAAGLRSPLRELVACCLRTRIIALLGSNRRQGATQNNIASEAECVDMSRVASSLSLATFAHISVFFCLNSVLAACSGKTLSRSHICSGVHMTTQAMMPHHRNFCHMHLPGKRLCHFHCVSSYCTASPSLAGRTERYRDRKSNSGIGAGNDSQVSNEVVAQGGTRTKHYTPNGGNLSPVEVIMERQVPNLSCRTTSCTVKNCLFLRSGALGRLTTAREGRVSKSPKSGTPTYLRDRSFEKGHKLMITAHSRGSFCTSRCRRHLCEGAVSNKLFVAKEDR